MTNASEYRLVQIIFNFKTVTFRSEQNASATKCSGRCVFVYLSFSCPAVFNGIECASDIR